jgi:GNAT superfamily N-acetyltransferase
MERCMTASWDERLWQLAEPIYDCAFPREGRKSCAIIRSMLERGVGQLHIGIQDGQAQAMALTGRAKRCNAIIIDYLAVRDELRGRGIGQAFFATIRQWAEQDEKANGIIIEVESDPTPDNAARIRFWQSCGFRLTEYVHHYRWVPEPYHAMVLPFHDEPALPTEGEELFRSINAFHAQAYRSS